MIGPLVRGEKALRLDVFGPDGESEGYLTPLTVAQAGDDELVSQLTRWRNRARGSFLTQFEPTPERTRRWLLETVLPDPARMLFLIHSSSRLVGQVGFKGLREATAELDNLIRGEIGGGPRLMLDAEVTLIRWMFETFGLESVEAVVLSGNVRPLALHDRIGFERIETVPLARRARGSEIHLVPCGPGCQEATGLSMEKLKLRRDRLCESPELP